MSAAEEGRIAIVVSGTDAVALADTMLSIGGQTEPALVVTAGHPLPRGVVARLELHAGDMLIADAVERLSALMRSGRVQRVTLPVLVQSFGSTLVHGAPGRSALGLPAAPSPHDRELVVTRTAAGVLGYWHRVSLRLSHRAATGTEVLPAGERPFAVLSRAAD